MKISDAKCFVYPSYMDIIYEGVYDNDKWYKKMDNMWNCQKKTFFQYKRLVNAVTSELMVGQRICQYGVTLGNQIDETALAIGRSGIYDVIDVNKNVIKRASDKYGKLYNHLSFMNNDAGFINHSATYNVVICFFLLSMVPLKHKKLIINNALKMLTPGGKAIFIDWHKPAGWNLLKLPAKMHNRLYLPFAEQLWEYNIKTLAENDDKEISWKKTTYLGGLFQKTVASKAIRQENLSSYNFNL